MQSSLKIFEVAGIEVRLHFSLIVILLLLIYAFFVSPPPVGFSNFPTDLRILLSILASFFIVLSILAHELAHSIVAKRQGIDVKGIVLFIFGGVAMMGEMPKDAKKEFEIAVSGPLMSFLIAFLFFFFASIFPDPLRSFSITLGYINVVLGLFNLIPAFPMDGGRVLRSVLASRYGYGKATRAAAEIGRFLAIMMAVFGIFYNPWLILIALFIYIGASEEEKLVTIESLLGKMRVKDIMTTNVIAVSPTAKVRDVLEMMIRYKHLGYPVVDGERVVGIITLEDILRSNPDEDVEKVMSRNVISIEPEKSAFEAFKIMSELRIGRLPVVSNGKLVGIVTRSDLMKTKEVLEALEVLGWKTRSL